MAGIEPTTLITIAKNSKCCTNALKKIQGMRTSELKFAPKQIGDTIQVQHKTALQEFQSYMAKVEEYGADYVPEAKDSVVRKFADSLWLDGNGNRRSKPLRPYIEDFRKYIFRNADNLNITKDEYWQIIDEIAASVQKEISVNPAGLRKEFVENAGKIQKWADIFATEAKTSDKRLVHHKFYDEKLYNQAIEEYKTFVENLTGKKVLIGSKSRMNVAVSTLGMLNNPQMYKDIDYILISHGTNSSLISDTKNPLTWRFSDNGQSVWEYIEKNVPKGKKVMVNCCEENGVKIAGKTDKELIDNNGIRMYGIGHSVLVDYSEGNPIKICESGIRHIIGHKYYPPYGAKTSFLGDHPSIPSCQGGFIIWTNENAKTVYYDLDYSKFRV